MLTYLMYLMYLNMAYLSHSQGDSMDKNHIFL